MIPFYPKRYKSIDSSQFSSLSKCSVKQYSQDDCGVSSKLIQQLSQIHVYHPKGFISNSKRGHKSTDGKAKQRRNRSKTLKTQISSKRYDYQLNPQYIQLKLPSITKMAYPSIQKLPITKQQTIDCLHIRSQKKVMTLIPKAIKTEVDQAILTVPLKIPNNKQSRKYRFIEAKKLFKKDEMFTKQGWNNQTKGQWLEMFKRPSI